MPRLSKEQEEESRREYLPEYERIKVMLGDGGALKPSKTKVKKRGLWSQIFGCELFSGRPLHEPTRPCCRRVH